MQKRHSLSLETEDIKLNKSVKSEFKHIEKKVKVEPKTELISDGLKALGTAEIVLKIDSTSDDFNALAIVENELKTDSTSDDSRLVGIYRRAENEHGDKLRAVISK